MLEMATKLWSINGKVHLMCYLVQMMPAYDRFPVLPPRCPMLYSAQLHLPDFLAWQDDAKRAFSPIALFGGSIPTVIAKVRSKVPKSHRQQPGLDYLHGTCLKPSHILAVQAVLEKQLLPLDSTNTPLWSTFCGLTNGVWRGKAAAFFAASGMMPCAENFLHKLLYKFMQSLPTCPIVYLPLRVHIALLVS